METDLETFFFYFVAWLGVHNTWGDIINGIIIALLKYLVEKYFGQNKDVFVFKPGIKLLSIFYP